MPTADAAADNNPAADKDAAAGNDPAAGKDAGNDPEVGSLHHVELWVPDLAGAERSWGWLLGELGWTLFQHWDAGRSWRLGATYLVFEESPALSARVHDRRAPGLNHLAFHVGPPAVVDRLTKEAPAHGWSLMFADRHPHAGGPDTYAAYWEDGLGYEVELVATDETGD